MTATKPSLGETAAVWLVSLVGSVTAVALFPALSRLNNGHCDAWYYFGAMLTAAVPPAWGRAMVTLPYLTIGHFAGRSHLEVVFFCSIISISTVATFAGLRRFFHPVAAAITTTVFCFSIFTLTIASTTYTAPALTYAGLGFYCLCRSRDVQAASARMGVLALAGLWLAFAANAHLGSLVVFAPLCLIVVARDRADTPLLARIVLGAVMVGAGFSVGLAFVAVVIGRMYGTAVSSLMQFHAAGAYVSSAYITDWTYPRWWATNPVIPFTLLVLATLPAGWRLLRARGWQDPAFVISMSGALSFLGVLVLVLLQKSVLLMYSHFSIWLVLPLAVSFVAPVDALVRRLDPLLDGVAYRVVAAQIVVSLVMLATLYGLYSAQLLLPWFVTTLLAAVVVAAIAVCVFTTQQAVMIAAVAFLLLPVAMQTFRADGYGGNFWGLDRSPWMVHQYALVKDAVAYIADRTQGRPLHFWISKAAYPLPRVGVFRSFARCAYDTNFPATLPDPTTTHWQGPLKAGALLVILTGPQERPQLGTPALNDKGLDFEMFASRDFVDGPAALGVHMGILKERR